MLDNSWYCMGKSTMSTCWNRTKELPVHGYSDMIVSKYGTVSVRPRQSKCQRHYWLLSKFSLWQVQQEYLYFYLYLSNYQIHRAPQ